MSSLSSIELIRQPIRRMTHPSHQKEGRRNLNTLAEAGDDTLLYRRRVLEAGSTVNITYSPDVIL